jgi:hypothetical protein
VRRGEGTFVSETPPPVEDTRRSSRLHEEAVRYASLAITLGASREEAVDTFETAWVGLTDGNSEGDAV